MAKLRLDYIDALRGIAALMVLVCHSLQMDSSLPLPHSFSASIEIFRYGVQLFFVISALTIFYSLHHSDRDSTNFFIRRFFRIAPLYFLAIIAYSLLQTFSPTGAAVNALFLHGFSPKYINSIVPAGWSIGVEMAFYCIIPFLFRRITNLPKALNFLFVSLLFSFACLYAYRKFIPSTPEAESFIYFYLPNQLPVFALGFIVYFLIFAKEPIDRKSLVAPVLRLSALVLVAIITRFAIFGEHFVFALACSGLVVVMAYRHLPLLVNPITLFFGKVSYSLYLGQYVGIILLSRWKAVSPIGPNTPAAPYLNLGFNLLLLLVFNTIMALLLYHIVEQPFQKLGRQIIRHRRQVQSLEHQTTASPAQASSLTATNGAI